MNTLTIGILTLNEAKRIQACVNSAQFANEIIVFDSGSRDDTVAIATQAGAKVYSNPDWQGFAEQRNRLLQHASGDYIFFLDADEEISPALAQEILAIVAQGGNAIGKICWEQVAFGVPLTHMKSTGGVERLFKRSTIVSFEGVVHEGAVTEPANLSVHTLTHKLKHYSRDSVHDSLLKLAQYAQLGALKRKNSGKKGGIVRGFFSGISNFVRLYVFGRGFLHGAAGFLYCLFVALECFFRYVALKYDADALSQASKRS
jgi:glycosyltransferase involved in cell wall biosynthesis